MQIAPLSSSLTSLLTPTALTANQTTAQTSTQTSGHVSLTLGTASGQDEAQAPSLSSVPGSTAEVFAAEIMRRIELANPAATASNAGSGVNLAAAGDLQAALSDAVDYVRQQHGDAAATAVMGIVIKGVGDGSGGEDALGDAMVSALKFIDRNFGVAAGDAAMAKFNGALNTSINDFYQNGHLEQFYASDGSGSQGSVVKQAQGVISSTLAHVTKQYGQDAAQAIADILNTDFVDAGSTREGLGKAVVAANAYLSENYGASPLDVTTQAQTKLPKGTVLSVAV